MVQSSYLEMKTSGICEKSRFSQVAKPVGFTRVHMQLDIADLTGPPSCQASIHQ